MRLEIETARLRLRPFEVGDAERVAELAGDYEVAKMCSRIPYPYSASEAAKAFSLL